MSGAFFFLLALETSVVVSDRSEVRVRDSNEPTGPAMDLETLPGLALRVADPRWELEAGYAPRLTAQAVNNASFGTEVLHGGTLGAAWHGTRLRLSLREDLLYGDESFSSLAATMPTTSLPMLETLPVATSFRYVDSRTALTSVVKASHRWALDASFQFVSSGGIGAASQGLIPYQQGPSGDVSAEYRASHADRLTTDVSVARLVFSSGPESTLVEATEAWGRALSRTAEAVLRGGVVTGAAGGGGEPQHGDVWPYAELSLHGELPERVKVQGSMLLAPVVDRLTGLVDERAQGFASARWTFAPRWSLRVEGAVAQSVQIHEKDALTVVLGETAVAWITSRDLVMELGTRGAWQEFTTVASPPQWVCFVAATFTSHWGPL